jgi:hypothetical protein
MNINNFITAFNSGVGSAIQTCQYGKTYFSSDGGFDWEEGQLERLQVHDDTIDTGIYAVEYLEFERSLYVIDCNCWHDRAEKIMAFLDFHAEKIGRYYQEERRRLQSEAQRLPLLNLTEKHYD